MTGPKRKSTYYNVSFCVDKRDNLLPVQLSVCLWRPWSSHSVRHNTLQAEVTVQGGNLPAQPAMFSYMIAHIDVKPQTLFTRNTRVVSNFVSDMDGRSSRDQRD